MAESLDTMAAIETQIEQESEQARIERWRAEELERAGFPTDVAAELAAEHYVDLHRALDLIARGCPHDLAARILL